jgi:hypothetical protein
MGVSATQAISRGLDRVADTIRVPLNYANGTTQGADRMVYTAGQGMEIETVVRCVKFFFNTHVGVLTHIMGDLYFLSSWFPDTGATIAAVVDGKVLTDAGKTPSSVITRDMSMKQVLDALGDSVVRMYLWRDKKWSPMKKPD